MLTYLVPTDKTQFLGSLPRGYVIDVGVHIIMCMFVCMYLCIRQCGCTLYVVLMGIDFSYLCACNVNCPIMLQFAFSDPP